MEMTKVQFGCGGNILDGWINHDMDVDIAKPLPYVDNSVDAIFTEHCIEHIPQMQAVDFLSECYRILKPAGILCVRFPDVDRIVHESNAAYSAFATRHGSDGTLTGNLRAIMFKHGHAAFWDMGTMIAACIAAGFSSDKVCESRYDTYVFRGAAGHWKVIGAENDYIESSSVDATK